MNDPERTSDIQKTTRLRHAEHVLSNVEIRRERRMEFFMENVRTLIFAGMA